MSRRPSRAPVRAFAAVLVASLVVAGLPAGAASRPRARAGDRPVVPDARAADLGGVRPHARELPGLRTATSRTYVDAGGTRRTEIFTNPVHFRAGGRWRRIDNSLVASSRPGYALENAAGPARVLLPGDLGAAPVRVEDGRRWIAFGLDGARGGAVVSDGAARYAGALEGVTAAYEAVAGGVKEKLVLAGPASPAAFSFELATSPGLAARAARSGGVEFVDRRGRVAFTMPAPFMYDAAGAVSHDVTLSVTGSSLRLAADEAWLADAARAWPVVVDPTLVAKPAQRDCWIGNGTEVASSNCGTNSDYIRVGYTGSAKRRGLVKFDVSSIPRNATVTDADLALYLDSSLTTTGRNADYVLRRIVNGRAWTTPTWTKYDTLHAWTEPGGDFGATDAGRNDITGATTGYKHFDPTWLVQDWVSGRYENNGVIVKQETETVENVVYFVSSNTPDESKWPKLTVTYSEPAVPASEGVGERDFYTYEEQRLDDRMELRVNVATGNLLVKESDLHVAGTGLDLTLERFYNSLSTASDPSKLGAGWVLGTGASVRLEFPRSGRVMFVGPSGYRVRFEENAAGDYLRQEPGLDASLEKNADGTYTLEWHDKERYDFDSTGKLTKHEDKNDNAITFEYNADGTLARIKDTQYDAATNADRVTRFTYTNGLLDAVHDVAGGRTYDYGYEATGDPARPYRLASFAVTTYALDTDQVNLGKLTTFGYDTSHRLTRITDPRAGANGSVDPTTTITYDGTTRRVKTFTRVTKDTSDVDPTWTFSYYPNETCDSTAEVVGKTVVNGPRTDVVDETTYCYDKHDRVVKTIDARGNERKNEYTSNSNVQQLTEAGAPQSYLFGWTDDNLTSVQLPSGGQATIKYSDAANPHFPTSVRDFANDKSSTNPSWAYDYDDDGNLIKAESVAEGIVFRYCYNGDGTLDRIDQPPADVSDDENPDAGCSNQPAGNDTLFRYDPDGNLAKVDPPGPNGSQSFTYDAVSRVKTFTDGKGQVWRFRYDALDRVTEIDYSADGSTSETRITYSYDENGNMTARNDNTGNSNFTYDDLNRMVKETPEAPSSTIDYTYDPAGNLKSVQTSDEPAPVRYAYDKVNLIEALIDQQGRTTRFEHNERGLRTKTTYPNGVVMHSKWDDSRRMEWIRSYRGTSSCPTNPSASTCITSFTYTYRAPNGNDTSSRYSVRDDVAGTTTNYRYDGIGRLEKACAAIPCGSGASDFQYTYDARGNMLTKAAGGTTTRYDYSPANELTCERTAATCDTALSSTTTYGYDLNGNLRSSSKGLQLTYNVKNQTTSITPPGAAALLMEYADATQDRRVVAGDRRMAYNQLGFMSQAPNNGVPHTTWFVRDNEGTLVSMLDRNDDTKNLYYLFDALGSVVATTDKAGNVVRRYRYEPYGKEIGPVATDPNPWRYASGYYDHATGMLKFGTRYYMPNLARWTQTDPVKGQPTDPRTLNPYVYVNDDPVNNNDPTGRVLPIITYLAGGVASTLAGGLVGSTVNLFAGDVASGAAGGCAAFAVGAMLTTGIGGLGVLAACGVGAALGAVLG